MPQDGHFGFEDPHRVLDRLWSPTHAEAARRAAGGGGHAWVKTQSRACPGGRSGDCRNAKTTQKHDRDARKDGTFPDRLANWLSRPFAALADQLCTLWSTPDTSRSRNGRTRQVDVLPAGRRGAFSPPLSWGLARSNGSVRASARSIGASGSASGAAGRPGPVRGPLRRSRKCGR